MGVLQQSAQRRDEWTRTHWSILGGLGRRDDPAWEQAWHHLVEAYRSPMHRHARRVLSRVRGRGASDEEAEEIVTAFLAKCFEKDWLQRADPLRGRFRAYVQTLLRRFVYAYVRHERAHKRSPGAEKQVFEILPEDAVDESSPQARAENAEFDRSWVKVAVDRTLSRLREEQARYLLVIEDLIATDGRGSDDLGKRVGLRRAQVPVLRHRARQRFLRLFEEELEATVGDALSFDEEWRALSPYLP